MNRNTATALYVVGLFLTFSLIFGEDRALMCASLIALGTIGDVRF